MNSFTDFNGLVRYTVQYIIIIIIRSSSSESGKAFTNNNYIEFIILRLNTVSNN